MNDWQERQKRTRQAIRLLKENDPAAYAKLMQRVQEMQQEEERRHQELLENQRLAEERTRLKRQRIEGAVMCVGVPIPLGLFSKPEVLECTGMAIEGETEEVLLAVRSWDVDGHGYLHGVGAGSSYKWREFNVADKVPTAHNGNGLYAVKLDPHGVIFGGISNYISRAKCCGLISVSGRVLDHTDGVMRAECATIKCIWYIGNEAEVYFDVPLLMQHYPTTPVYVCTQNQVAEALIMIVGWMTAKGGV